ncbi:hypothetical protein BH09PLA1_BH09PLA1_00940 [soil metagenome]
MSLSELPISSRDRAAEDMALLRQYVDEDSQDAFAALLDRHAAWIHASARRALRTRDLADDAMQTVFVILARKAPSISPNVRVSGWLYHTTRFVISDLRKRAMRHRRRHELIMRAALERRVNDGPRAGRRLDHVRETIAEALARLPEHERDAISMHFFDGMTFRQMGEALGLSREGAKKRVARAMARLRAGFAVEGAAVAALATIGAAIRAVLAPTTVKAAITTLGNPAISLTKTVKIIGGGVKLLINELTANALRITAVRVATAGAVVGTAVLCGSKMPSANDNSSAGRQVAMQLPALTRGGSRTPHLSSPAPTGAIASAEQIRNAEAPHAGLRTIEPITPPSTEVRGANLLSRTIGAGSAVAVAQFEDPFKRPAVYVRESADRSQSSSTRVDDFRGSGGGSSVKETPGETVRQTLEVPKLIDPKQVEPSIADAGAKAASPDHASQSPAGEVNRRIRRGTSEDLAANQSANPTGNPGGTPAADRFKNLSIHGSGAGDHAAERTQVATGAPAPAAASDKSGETRPTLSLPPKAPQGQSTDSEQRDDTAPDRAPDQQPGEKVKQGDEHHDEGLPIGGSADPIRPAPPVIRNFPPGQTGRNETGRNQTGHNELGGNQSYGHDGEHQSTGAPAGDDGGFRPPPVKPLPGGSSYDLLDHDAPSPTPIADDMPPVSDEVPSLGAPAIRDDQFLPPVLSDEQIQPSPVAAMQLLGMTRSPLTPSMQVLPEPSAAIVALIAGAIGLARRRRQ